MADGHAALDAQIARLRSLGPALTTVAAPEVAAELERELGAQIGRGEGPAGEAWKPTADGRQPLRNAASALTVRSVGSVVVATLDGVEARHHIGAVRGGVRRRILPSAGLPEPMSRAIQGVLARRFAAHMGGR